MLTSVEGRFMPIDKILPGPSAVQPESPFGDWRWLRSKTGWDRSKIARLARVGAIPGSIQAQQGVRGSPWIFRKTKVLAWLKKIES
jgi:hypothetical protein